MQHCGSIKFQILSESDCIKLQMIYIGEWGGGRTVKITEHQIVDEPLKN